MNKQCTGCKRYLAASKFTLDSSKSHGLASRCKDCNKEYRRNMPDALRRARNEQHKEWVKRNPEKARRSIRSATLKNKYGIDADQFDSILRSQGGVCAICKSDKVGCTWGQFRVDHCHRTGVVRGILCHNCNVGLGKFRDNSKSLIEAAKYLEIQR